MKYSIFAFLIVVQPLVAAEYLIAPGGINSAVTGLDGTNVLIGQVEQGRPGKPGYDTNPNLFASNTVPTGVYFGASGGMDAINSLSIDDHATEVAGLMIAKDESVTGEKGADFTFWVGVAPNAELHASATGSLNDVGIASTLNRIATLSGGNVRATNMSFGRELQPFVEEPGTSHWTQFVDWSSRQHDLLYVAGWGNAPSFETRTPADNYNGLTVAASVEESESGTYLEVSDVNATNFNANDNRHAIDILAPGEFIRVLATGDNGFNEETVAGTSFATPHVTGSVALLQQYGTEQGLGFNSRHHEVMKAVMLNSADKLSGVHGSSRTILDSNDMDWTESEAFGSQFVSLDDQMGAGHLNVERAVQQLGAGEHPVGQIPLIGWDYSSIGATGSRFEYTFNEPLSGDQYLAATLVWDRRIESTGGSTYNVGDQFSTYGVANLDLRLETTGGTTIWTSQTFEDNVEHIFFDNFGAGEYKLVVEHSTADIGNPLQFTDYALAWWYGTPEDLPGDYDGDGDVDSNDYDEWGSSFGMSVAAGSGADGNGNGIVDAADYTVWRDHLGQTLGSSSLATVPEPGSLCLVFLGLAIATSCCRRRGDQA